MIVHYWIWLVLMKIIHSPVSFVVRNIKRPTNIREREKKMSEEQVGSLLLSFWDTLLIKIDMVKEREKREREREQITWQYQEHRAKQWEGQAEFYHSVCLPGSPKLLIQHKKRWQKSIRKIINERNVNLFYFQLLKGKN